ncbi:OpgC family protein [Methyloceanibacter sp.]|uniref:OpgC family protein n=1 Tax=Methyloceanibacter sp. TaxID=1965321 RepID=UPI003D6DA1A6
MVVRESNSGPGTRDLRIDFFRGIALYMIIVDHIPNDPLNRFTYARLGLSDAAEIFVFLSGVSCGIVFYRLLLRQGFNGFIKAITKRAFLIYVYYLVASIVTIAIIAASRDILTIPANQQAFIDLHEAPFSAILSAIRLTSPPELPGILVLYLELTLLAIPAFLLFPENGYKTALVCSGVIWALSQSYPNILPHLADHSYFNPLAWQFLFCIGMFIGTTYTNDTKPLEGIQTKNWVIIAWSIVLIELGYRLALAVFAKLHVDVDWLTLSDPTLHHMKENLSALRLLHFLSIAFLVAIYIKRDNPVLSWPGAGAIIKSGRSSLQVFCMGAIFAVLLNLFVAVERPLVFERLVIDGAAIFLIGLTATLLMRARLDRREARARELTREPRTV